MSNELSNAIWTEAYRPQTFDDIIVEKKSLIQNYIKDANKIPSFIFSSARPGTGKSSIAKIIVKYLKCDVLYLNASDERGIDTVREKIKVFAESMSSLDGMKRCVFCDEGEKITSTAQDALRNLLETYSDNCFFIFTCNDLSKIIEPIRSRCVCISFDKPDKLEILQRLQNICEKEGLDKLTDDHLLKLTNICYPDIRSMVIRLQNHKIDGQDLFSDDNIFMEFAKAIKGKNLKYIYDTIYSGQFNILEFNKWYFQKTFEAIDKLGVDKAAQISMLLADVEKNWSLGANLDLVFLNSVLQIISQNLIGD